MEEVFVRVEPGRNLFSLNGTWQPVRKSDSQFILFSLFCLKHFLFWALLKYLLGIIFYFFLGFLSKAANPSFVRVSCWLSEELVPFSLWSQKASPALDFSSTRRFV